MEGFIIKLDETMGKMFAIHEEMSKQPRDYGCGITLYPSDIHMIEAIGNYPNMNMTQISEVLGLTKGTVSKLIKKTEAKGFVRKYHYPNNRKEVFFKLTELGDKAFKGHYELHENKSSEVYRNFNGYTSDEKKFLLGFIKEYTNMLEQYIDKKIK